MILIDCKSSTIVWWWRASEMFCLGNGWARRGTDHAVHAKSTVNHPGARSASCQSYLRSRLANSRATPHTLSCKNCWLYCLIVLPQHKTNLIQMEQRSRRNRREPPRGQATRWTTRSFPVRHRKSARCKGHDSQETPKPTCRIVA